MSMGTVAMGLPRFKFQNGLPKAVNNIGAASPSAREIAKTPPVIKALEETGNTIPIMVRHFGTPSASEGSRSDGGTKRNASCEVIRTIGTMIMA